MARTVKELREFLKNIPDDVEVWGYEGEASGVVFCTKDMDTGAFFDNDNPAYDDLWPVSPSLDGEKT